jgi:hypothetical protein
MTETRRPEFLEMVQQHFNEPMLSMFSVVRCIGYAEDADDCYIIYRHQGRHDGPLLGEVGWHSMVGGYTFLDRLKGQGHVKAHTSEDWDDLVRLDNLLALNGTPKEDAFLVKIEHQSTFLEESDGMRQSKLRPANFNDLSTREQWEIDKRLGILDWDGT